MKTKISVILPVYNAENSLEAILKAISAQSLKDIEIICIDSGSKDSSAEILEKFKPTGGLKNFFKNKMSFKVINKINEGLGSAINAGLNVSEGEYVSIISPGDIIDKKMYETLYKLAKTCDADIVKSPYYKKDGSLVLWQKSAKIPAWYFRICECPLFLSFHPSISSSLYKRTFLNENSIRFVQAPEHSFVDMPFNVETLLLAQKIIYTNKAFCRRPKDVNEMLSYGVFALDRADEAGQILIRQKIKDKNILSCVYKRELKYIENVLNSINQSVLPFDKFNIKNVPYEIQLKIEKIIANMDEEIIKNNPFISDYERNFYNLYTLRASI